MCSCSAARISSVWSSTQGQYSHLSPMSAASTTSGTIGPSLNAHLAGYRRPITSDADDPPRRDQQAVPQRPGRRPRALARHPRRRGVRARRSVGVRQDDDAEDGEPAHRADVGAHLPRRTRRHPRRSGRAAPSHRLRDPAGRAVPAPDHRRQHRHGAEAARLGQGAHRRRASTSCSSWSGSMPPTTAVATRRSSPVGSANAWAWRARSPPIRRCC